jgi:hypothetical protein
VYMVEVVTVLSTEYTVLGLNKKINTCEIMLANINR